MLAEGYRKRVIDDAADPEWLAVWSGRYEEALIAGLDTEGGGVAIDSDGG